MITTTVLTQPPADPILAARDAAHNPRLLTSGPMTRAAIVTTFAALLCAGAARAQDPPETQQTQQQYSFQVKADALLRQEWTRTLFQGAPDQERWRIQVRPRLEMAVKWLLLGVGAEFNHSKDDNTALPAGATTLALVRDNYRSRDTRLDLAFASLRPASWLRLEAGRFPMALGLTEMIWDRDLRPQGAALHLGGGDSRLGVSVVGSRGGHVFDDDETETIVVSAGFTPPAEARTKLELLASYIAFLDVGSLEPAIRRQNSRLAAGGPLALDYRVIDAVLRLRHEGVLPWQVVADVCWNTAAESDRRGLWLAFVVGSTRMSRTRVEYTFARVDKDATLAAYPTDDFFWGTGWEGHRGDLGIRVSDNTALHGVAQLQRFKDSAREAERDHWVRRYRVDLRYTY
jgi:hypothetical protein